MEPLGTRNTLSFHSLALGTLGGIVGAIVGGAIFWWLVTQGLYAMVIPGAAIGLGVGASARVRSAALGGYSAVLALVTGICLEWVFFPFVKDPSFYYFLTHLWQVQISSLLLIGIGSAVAFWLGRGR